MTDIQVRGTTDPTAIAVVVALLSSRTDDDQTSARTGVAAWRQVRRAALAERAARRIRPAIR
ncbi:hypothetical protein ACXR2U_01580 [Jatrophihabitans sp. YIM 134969]